MKLRSLTNRYKIEFVLFFGGALFIAIMSLAMKLVMAETLGLMQDPSLEEIKSKAWIFILCAILIGLQNFFHHRFRLSFIRSVKLGLKQDCFSNIINKSFREFNKKSKENYISNLVNDIDLFEKDFFYPLSEIISSGFSNLISFIALIYLDWKFALILLILSTVFFFFSKMFEKPSKNLKKKVSDDNEEFSVSLSNTLNGIEILKLNSVEKTFCDKTTETVKAVEHRKLKYNFLLELQTKGFQFLSALTTVFILAYCMFKLFNLGDLATTALMFQFGMGMTQTARYIFPCLTRYKAATEIYDKLVAGGNTAELLDNEISNENILGTKDFNFENKISVKDLAFYYDEKLVFNNANFEIEKGKKYLIRGPSGAGKTTLMNILSKTMENYKGFISVDNIDLHDIKLSSFNNKIGFIFQNVFLFEDSIKNNIELYHDYDETKLNSAIKSAGLEELIKTQKDGVDTVLAENGKDLSGGQRQRVSIARAIIKDAEIIFADEATSSLDPELGRQIEDELLSLDSTLIAISHRYYEGITEKYDYVIQVKDKEIDLIPSNEYNFTLIQNENSSNKEETHA